MKKREDYRRAQREGRRQVARALSQGRQPYLPSLDELLIDRPVASEMTIGLCEIPLELVAGTRTEGRRNLFSEGFLPLADAQSEFAAKWSRLLDAQVEEGIRDPIVAFEYLQRFYVQEGNKRVSVAKWVGMPTIAAHVTRILPLSEAEADETLERYREFESFYGVAPLYDLSFSRCGDYERLARLLGQDLEHAWSEEVVRHLKASFSRFATAFRSRGGERLGCTPSDAYLLYLQAYATAEPMDATGAQLDSRIKALWDEFLLLAKTDPVSFVQDPPTKGSGAIEAMASMVRQPKPVGIAFVYDRATRDSGWAALHERGRTDLERRSGGSVFTQAFEGCSDDDAFEEAIDAAERNGCSVVVTVSPRQMEQSLRAALAHPKLEVVNCSVNISRKAVRTLYTRMYEVKFVMGALAASLSQSHHLGYLATSPINGAVSEVNAFSLGAALVDPYATVHLRWLTSDADWESDLRKAGVDVVAGRDYPDPTNPAAPFGLYALPDGLPCQVAVPIWDWGRAYELLLRALRDDHRRKEAKLAGGRAVNYWWGIRSGVARLDLAEGVAEGQRRLVDLLTDALREGRICPFDGVLLDQRSDEVNAGSTQLSDERIASMAWLNVNVEGRLPAMEELNVGGRADVAASGVLPASKTAKGT